MNVHEPSAPPAPAVRWTVVVPLKELDRAKSRLAGLGPLRRDAARAMAADTLAAAAGAARVRVVTDDAELAGLAAHVGGAVTPDPGADLDAAVLAGAAAARDADPGCAVAALVGDLPCLTAPDLARVLHEAAHHARAVVPDAAGTGTVLLTAGPGQDLRPRFGAGSAARHARDAVVLDAPPAVRLDVDDVEAWARALAAGVGPRTGALAAAARSADRVGPTTSGA